MHALLDGLMQLWHETGIYLASQGDGWKSVVMVLVCLVLLYLAIKKEFEPLLLLPIGFGGLLANLPGTAEFMTAVPDTTRGAEAMGAFLGIFYYYGIESGLCPLLIFMGVGAMTDFGPLLANPKTALLGVAAQFGIFTTVIGAVLVHLYVPGVDFFDPSNTLLSEPQQVLRAAASIGIIGGADGPTAIYTTTRLYRELLGAVAVAAYSYMALVPIIQPPIMRLLTTRSERAIEMKQLRPVSKLEKILFPLVVLGLCAALLPSATPLIGALMFGNLARESGVVQRLSDTMQNALVNIITIVLGLGVGMKLSAAAFLRPQTLGILALGLLAFAVATASGVLMGKLMNLLSREPINPLIGAAGVSAVPMAARVANKVGQEENPHNFLLMHAMGPNVAGVIGSAVAAGVLIAVCSRLAP